MANQDASITISVIAKDLASGNIGKAVSGLDSLAKKGGLVGSMAQGVGQSFGQMLNPIGLVTRGVGMLTDFLQDGVKSAMEEETSLKRLDTALANNVKSWDGSHAAIEADIEAKMLLGFQDDILRDSMIKLVTATGDQNEAMRLNGLAMDIARGRNIDLASATDIVVKANLGNTRALKLMGIDLGKAATKTEILAELQRRFGGQAEAYGDTTAGAMEAAQIAIGELGEDIGGMLIPIIGDAAKVIVNDLIPAIRDIAGVLDEVGVKIGELERLAGSGTSSQDSLFGRLFPHHDTGALGGTFIDSITDAIHAGNAWLTGTEPAVPLGEEITAQVGEGMMHGPPLPEGWGVELFGPPLPPGWGEREGGPPGAELGDALRTSFMSQWPPGTAHDVIVNDLRKATDEAKDLAAQSGRGIGNNLADTLRGTKDIVKSAMDDVMWAIKHPMAEQKNLARIEGALTTLEYKRGLASNTDEVNTVIDQQMQVLRDAWTDITGRAYGSAVAVVNNYERGLRTFSPGNVFGGILRDRSGLSQTGGGRAAGGPVMAGIPYIVGEKRAELFVPDQNGTILPSVPSARGGATFNFHYHGLTPPTPSQAQQIAQAMMPGFVREMRRQQIL